MSNDVTPLSTPAVDDSVDEGKIVRKLDVDPGLIRARASFPVRDDTPKKPAFAVRTGAIQWATTVPWKRQERCALTYVCTTLGYNLANLDSYLFRLLDVHRRFAFPRHCNYGCSW